MIIALAVLFALLFYVAAEAEPELNEYLQVVKFPSDEFRSTLLNIMILDAVGAFVIEKLCLWTLTDY